MESFQVVVLTACQLLKRKLHWVLWRHRRLLYDTGKDSVVGVRLHERLECVTARLFSVRFRLAPPQSTPVQHWAAMKFYRGGIGRIKACRDLVQFFTDPIALALENTKASEYKILLAWVLCRAGFISVQKVHGSHKESQSGKDLAFTIR